MFSVIIPLYNKATYIKKALISVLKQTYPKFEIIIVDDGSTDNPLPPKEASISERLGYIDNIEKWKDKVKILEQENSGVSTARNNGVKYAKYDYIAFLDADDWWEPDFLEKMKKIIERYPDAGIYGCRYNIVKNNHPKPVNLLFDKNFEDGYMDYFKIYAATLQMPLWTGAVILPKEVFLESKGFNPNLKLGEDFDLWVRIALKQKVAYLNMCLSNYNQDVNDDERAIGLKFYQPEELVLFNKYSEVKNQDFIFLFEKLKLYGFIPYYANNKYTIEIKDNLKSIHWQKHEFKYRLIYRILPLQIVSLWFKLLLIGSKLKSKFIHKQSVKFA